MGFKKVVFWKSAVSQRDAKHVKLVEEIDQYIKKKLLEHLKGKQYNDTCPNPAIGKQKDYGSKD